MKPIEISMATAMLVAVTSAAQFQPQMVNQPQPLLMDMGGAAIQLTSPELGVEFDLDGDGRREQVAWTKRDSRVGFLAVDWNRNGFIDSGHELIGAASGPRDAFQELAAYDGFSTQDDFNKAINRTPDGVITAADAIFHRLLLWTDLNHNGLSEENEIVSLANLKITEIDLREVVIGRNDDHGNSFRSEAKAYGGPGLVRTISKVSLRAVATIGNRPTFDRSPLTPSGSVSQSSMGFARSPRRLGRRAARSSAQREPV